jgi:phospholipid/cholesterol/gamma-HCH transport system ATP-binding protein
MSVPLIELKKVTKRFGEKTILDQVDLALYEGEATAVIGKSGVGKSVLLKHIIGLLDPDEGDILYKGKIIRDMNRKERRNMKRNFSYMFQSNALFDSWTVFQNIALPLIEKGAIPAVDIEKKVMSKIEQLELSEVTFEYPSQLSGGMQKRVALARALVTEPRIVLFDEPTTGLDPIRKNAVLGMIAHYRRQFGFTAVVVSHDIPDIFFISNRIVILYDSKVIFQGTPFEIEQFDHPLVDEMIHSLRSLKDELTGLGTRQGFERQYQQGFSAVKTAEDLTVVLFTIDNLLAIEEEIGGIAAQQILKTIAALIEKNTGGMGISARYSHEEILTVLPHTDEARAEAFVNSLVVDLQSHEILDPAHYPKACFGFSIQVGISRGNPETGLSRLVAQAKEAQRIRAEMVCGIENRGNQ